MGVLLLPLACWPDLPHPFSTQDPGAYGMQEITTLATQLVDPKLAPAQRDALMKKLENMQETMQAEMEKMADPANIAKAQQKLLEFGCERFSVGILGGNLNGNMRCAQKVGTNIALTGTLKFLGR
jgi:hypothetical protein